MYLLNQVNQAIRTELDSRLRVHEITGLQYTILTMVRSNAGISSAELSRRFFVTPQTMSEVVGGLERRGLIERRPLAGNRRILTATLTEAGRRLTAECDRVADAVEEEAFAGMSEAELDTLRGVLRSRIQARDGSAEGGD